VKVEYILVGLGLAGLAIGEELQRRGRSFVVFEDGSQTSSLVAGGMYNPVILKRFTPVWNASEQLQLALPFYEGLEKKLGGSYDEKLDILRVFKSVEEQNNWFMACDKPVLGDFMQPELVRIDNPCLRAPFGAGRVVHTGRIRVKSLLDDYRSQLKERGQLVEETFNYEKLEDHGLYLAYGEVQAGRIVFCEGNGLRNNPFFRDLPMTGTKGELLTIRANGLKLETVLKSAVFLMPLGGHSYKVGATFNWQDKTNVPTPQGREELEAKLREVISCSYTVTGHEAGVRPTTGDRRPLVGTHPHDPKLAVCNGLGTRGVMVGPLMARKLIAHLEDGRELDKEISIGRFRR